MSDIKKPTIEELEKILASNDQSTIHIAPDGSVFVSRELDRLRTRVQQLEALEKARETQITKAWKQVSHTIGYYGTEDQEIWKRGMEALRILEEIPRGELPNQSDYSNLAARVQQLEAALRQCEQMLNYLNVRGGLGSEVHRMIDEVVKQATEATTALEQKGEKQ